MRHLRLAGHLCIISGAETCPWEGGRISLSPPLYEHPYTVAVKIKFPQWSDFTAEINGKLGKNTATNYPSERLLKQLYGDFSKRFLIYYCVACPHQLLLGFPSLRLQLLLHPAANCTVSLLDLDFFSNFLLL